MRAGGSHGSVGDEPRSDAFDSTALPACGRRHGSDGAVVRSGKRSQRRLRTRPIGCREGDGTGGVDPTTRRLALVVGPVALDLAGYVVETWGYTGDPIRATAGEVLEVALRNELLENTTIH